MSLVLVTALIACVDFLARNIGMIGSNQVYGWVGPPVASPWSDAISAKNGLRLTSRDLAITAQGDDGG